MSHMDILAVSVPVSPTCFPSLGLAAGSRTTRNRETRLRPPKSIALDWTAYSPAGTFTVQPTSALQTEGSPAQSDPVVTRTVATSSQSDSTPAVPGGGSPRLFSLRKSANFTIYAPV